MNKTLTYVSLAAFAALALLAAAPVQAEPTTVGVGDCNKFSGACAGVCVDTDAGCHRNGVVCAGASYMVPQCVRGH